MGLAVAAMGSAHGVLLVSNGAVSLYLGVCLGGLAYGAFWPLIPTLTGELFGMKVSRDPRPTLNSTLSPTLTLRHEG